MASGGAKNVVLTVIAIGAIGAAIYLIMNSPGSGGSKQDEGIKHYVDETSIGSGNPAGISLTVSEFKAMARSGTQPVASNGSTDLLPAGICPNGHYYLLIGHGSQPDKCSTCDAELAGFDLDGNPL